VTDEHGNNEPTITTWICVVCGESHPIDHEGLFCRGCGGMACCGCELRVGEHVSVCPLNYPIRRDELLGPVRFGFGVA
jgi:hypothetical protein